MSDSARRTPKAMKAKKKKMNKKMGTVDEDVGEPQLISEEGPQEVEDYDDTDALVMAAMQGNVEAVEVLLETGVDVNHKDSIGVCPLHWAAFCGHSDVARRLLLAKADLHIKDREGRTPLHVASYERSEGQTEVLRTLIEAGSDLHAPDNAGWTPLHCAVSNGVLDAINLLINAGADPLRKDAEGKTPKELAIHFRKADVITIMEQAQEKAEVMALKGLGIGTHRGEKARDGSSPKGVTMQLENTYSSCLPACLPIAAA